MDEAWLALSPSCDDEQRWQQTNRGEPASAREPRAATLYSVGPAWGPDHEAAMRFSSEAPRHRASAAGCRNCIRVGNLRRGDHAAIARMRTPSGITPVVTIRHIAMSSLRARATIMVVLRAPCLPSVRVRYHCANALSFWNRRNRQASWIRPRRTRALPALAKPFSRRLAPLSSGEPVRPA